MSDTGWIKLTIDKLVPAAWNYKTDDEDKQKSLEENIKRNGQIENIIVRKLETGFYEVVNGNHRLKAFAALGLVEIMTFSLGSVSEAQARRVAVETNETRFSNDPLKLAGILKELTVEFKTEDLLTTLPFTKEELDAQFQLIDFDFNSTPDGTYSAPPTEDWETVAFRLPSDVAAQLNEQIDRFKKLLYPDQELKDVAITMPIEAICQVLAQTEDHSILGNK